MYELLLLLANYAILTNFLLNKKMFAKPHHTKVSILTATIIVSIIAHIVYFILMKEKNLFEKYNLPRYTETEEFQDSQAELMLSYLKLNDFPEERHEAELYVVKNTLLRTLYDKFGEDVFNRNFSDLKSLKTYIFEKNTFETIGFYVVGILLMQYVTTKDNIKGIKKWMACLLAVSFLLEVNTFLDESANKNIIDDFFPHLATFERVIFARIMLIAVANFVRLSYKLLYKNKKKKMEEIHKVICSHNKKLLNYVESSKVDSDSNGAAVKTQLKEIDNNLGKIGTYIQTELEYHESKIKNTNKSKILAIAGILVAVAYYVPIVKKLALLYITSPPKTFIR